MASSAAKRPWSVAPSSRTSIGLPSPSAKSSQRERTGANPSPCQRRYQSSRRSARDLEQRFHGHLGAGRAQRGGAIGRVGRMAFEIDPHAQHRARTAGLRPGFPVGLGSPSVSSRMPANLAPSTSRSFGHLQRSRRAAGKSGCDGFRNRDRGYESRAGPPGPAPHPGAAAANNRDCPVAKTRRGRAGRARRSAGAPRRGCLRRAPATRAAQRLFIGAVDAVEIDERKKAGRRSAPLIRRTMTRRLPGLPRTAGRAPRRTAGSPGRSPPG